MLTRIQTQYLLKGKLRIKAVFWKQEGIFAVVTEGLTLLKINNVSSSLKLTLSLKVNNYT